MDRLFASKLLIYVAIGLAIAYLWKHYWWLSNAFRVMVSDWWH